ncbi:MAG: hypothetical protein P4L22_02000 [Candidatus Babeliales bacterium]|nr:hypothetical protein [Candidatus Babeliales bacterium]
MNIFRLLVISILFSVNIYSFASDDVQVTIFVHGTRRLSKLFLKYTTKENKITNVKDLPTSCKVTRSMSKTLEKVDSNNFAKEQFYVFGWSGKLSHKARVQAASIFHDQILKLVEDLKKQNINPVINIITHSHGGNVVLNMASLDLNNKLTINNLILLACPVQEHTRKLVNHDLFKNVYNIYSTLDSLQILDPQGLHAEHQGKKVPFFSQRTFDTNTNLKQAKIKIRNCGVTHSGFLMPRFFKRLPVLLDKMKQSPCDSVAFIKI